MAAQLKTLTLRGFKTIRELNDFELGPLTVLIGPNGAGKSNFVSFFRLLSWALGTRDGLQTRIAEEGGAAALLRALGEERHRRTPHLMVRLDDPDTVPSKRISRLIPEYRHRKRSAGPLITTEVGLPKLREKCPHFNRWIEMLESIGKAGER